MTALESAIALLREEIDAFGHGQLAGGNNPRVPDSSIDFYLLRAKVLGMAYLKRLQQLELHGDAAACHRLYERSGAQFKSATPPPAPSIEKERLPDGTLPAGVVQ